MLAVAEPTTTVEATAPNQTPVVTTLYDLIAALQDQVEPWEDDVVTATVVDLCNHGQIRFLDMPTENDVRCA